MKKTIGGNRLGNGNKMMADLHEYGRSTHDTGFVMRTSMSAGTLVPVLSRICTPGTTTDINLNMEILTYPTVGPLFGSYKAEIHVFECPIRLYQGHMRINEQEIGLHMETVKFPTITLTAKAPPTGIGYTADNIDNSQINPSCILAYLGIRGVGTNTSTIDLTRTFNAIPYLAYWDVYKNYYANKQEETGVVIHTSYPALVESIVDIEIAGMAPPIPDLNGVPEPYPIHGVMSTQGQVITVNWAVDEPLWEQVMIQTTTGRYSIDQIGIKPFGAGGGTALISYNFDAYGPLAIQGWSYLTETEIANTPPGLTTFPLSSIDTMQKRILAAATVDNTAFDVNAQILAPYQYAIALSATGRPFALGSQEGLGIKTYNSDLLQNWIKTDWIDSINAVSSVAVAVAGAVGTFTIDSLNMASKIYLMMNRIAISGGSLNDYIQAVYSHQAYMQGTTPTYVGGLIKELIFQEVVSNAATDIEGGQPLGTLAGKGVLAKKHKGGKVRIKCNEPCYILAIASLTPRIDYSQGNQWDVHLETMADLHKPQLDQIGFQESITEQRAWWDTQYDLINNRWATKSAGKVPAWINYQTDINKTFGNFAIASKEMFMTLNRRYEFDNTLVGPFYTGIKDLTTYIDPAKYNQIFAATQLDNQNFWVQIALDIESRIIMSGKMMPNL